MSPMVSVVIPVYNMETFLAETLESVLSSVYPSFEVIVMDDGSKDNSLAVARSFAEKDSRVKVFTQKNAGACAARNNAISKANGIYILPVDADNLVEPTFIGDAAAILKDNPEVKVVAPRSDFFGARSGEWKLPPFSLKLIARKNIMDTCAMYRKSDWERIGGYCEEIIAREDWEFWISMLKDGGEVRKLPYIALHYRVREGSKRVTDRALKKHVIAVLNRRHPEFFHRFLGGPLRYRRTWSRVINIISGIFSPSKVFVSEEFKSLSPWIYNLPQSFDNDGISIYKGRNELREKETPQGTMIVKSYKRPHFINRIVYEYFRSSKAERAYQYAELFRSNGIGSPQPVGFITKGNCCLFDKSYFVCLKSECPYTFRDFAKKSFERKNEILQEIGKVTARMHEAGLYHEDYSAGNILFRDDLPEIKIEIIDLNRLTFGKVNLEKGCKNFERLPMDEETIRVMIGAYAEARGFDKEQCIKIVNKGTS